MLVSRRTRREGGFLKKVQPGTTEEVTKEVLLPD